MNCKNCNADLPQDARFCLQCGGRVVDQSLTFGYLATEASERFFNFENNFLWRTFKDMFRKPEMVIDGFIDGVRKRHMNVFNYLALAITLSGLQIFLMQKFFTTNMDLSWMLPEDNPMNGNLGFMDVFLEYQSALYIIFIPIYAIFAWLTFLNLKKYSYLKHVVITTYSQAHLSIFMVIPTIVCLMLGFNFFKFVYFFSFPFMILYSAYVYKRLYKFSVRRIIWKTIWFLIITGGIYIIFNIIVWVILFATGAVDLQKMMDAQKAQQEATSYIVSSAINWTS